MKSILMSVQPKWVEKIASGEKTVEVRRTAPKLEVPFKCYIYCTNGEKLFNNTGAITSDGLFYCGIDKYMEVVNGKVVGEFVCDKIECVKCLQDIPWNDHNGERELRICKDSCITFDEIAKYGEGSNLWAWHISDLKIYDTPKELSEFWRPCPFKTEDQDNDCIQCDAAADSDMGIVCTNRVWKAPQSWCYVEELGE